MARLKKLLSLAFLILAVLCFLVFYFRNTQSVSVDLIVYQFDSLGIGFWILSSFVVGAIIGILVSWPAEIFLKASKKSKEKRLDKATTELSRIKSSTARGG